MAGNGSPLQELLEIDQIKQKSMLPHDWWRKCLIWKNSPRLENFAGHDLKNNIQTLIFRIIEKLISRQG